MKLSLQLHVFNSSDASSMYFYKSVHLQVSKNMKALNVGGSGITGVEDGIDFCNRNSFLFFILRKQVLRILM